MFFRRLFASCFGGREMEQAAPQAMGTREAQEGGTRPQRPVSRRTGFAALLASRATAPTLQRRAAAGRVQYSGLSELQAMMDLLRELDYEAAKRARMASRTATDAADSDDESEWSSSAASVAGTVGSIDVHDSSDSGATEQAAEVQGVAQRLQHSEAQATQVCPANERLQQQRADLRVELTLREEQHEESDDSWHASAHDASERAHQHQAHVSPELLPRYVAAQEGAGALQSKVQELEEGRMRLQEHCDVLQAADQNSRRALRRCEAARQAAEDRAIVKAEESCPCYPCVTELVVPSLQALEAEKTSLLAANQGLKEQLHNALAQLKRLHA